MAGSFVWLGSLLPVQLFSSFPLLNYRSFLSWFWSPGSIPSLCHPFRRWPFTIQLLLPLLLLQARRWSGPVRCFWYQAVFWPCRPSSSQLLRALVQPSVPSQMPLILAQSLWVGFLCGPRFGLPPVSAQACLVFVLAITAQPYHLLSPVSSVSFC